MKTTNINTGVNSLLEAAKYVREETLINGNQAAQLDSLINAVMELTAHVNEYTAKIADRVAAGLSVERLQRWVESAKAKLTAAVASLHEWLKAFKADRPNVAINIEGDEDSTPENDTTVNDTTESTQEYNHAAHCLGLYLNNTSEIYNRFTLPAIAEAATGIRHHGKLFARLLNSGAIASADKVNNAVDKALQAAARLARKYDHMTPTPADIEAVKAVYVAYIIECAQYEVNNA